MPEAILVYGNSGTGKTTLALRCYKMALSMGWVVGGIISPGTFQDNVRSSFDVVDLWTGNRTKLATRGLIHDSPIHFGKFGFYHKGFEFGHSSIDHALSRFVDLLIMDEIGPLELSGQGWAKSLHKAVEYQVPKLLLTVRPSILDEVRKIFLQGYSCLQFHVDEENKIFEHWKLSNGSVRKIGEHLPIS